jgi:chromate transporter
MNKPNNMSNKIKEYWELFLTFFKIGAFTFGGGYAMIPLIRNEVNRKGWLEDDEFMDMLAVAQSMPGPIALNTALFVGNKRLGFKGSLFSGAGVILPSFIAILLIAVVFTQFKDNPIVERIFKGIRPAVVALIVAPLLSLGKSAGVRWKNLWIPVVVALAVWQLNISPMYIVLAAILLGISHFIYLKKRVNK